MLGSKRLESIKNQGKIIFSSRFLKNLSSAERYEFLQLCHRRQYKESEYIYYQGDPGTGMYFIEDGKVQLIINSAPDSDKEDFTYKLEAPDSFGALSIGYELRRFSSVKCLTDCTLLGFFKPDFETLKKRHPAIALKFMEKLAMIAMKQLDISTKALQSHRGKVEAYRLQFETYYQSEDNESL
jgi:CRP-like cAMP-binding protein